MLLKWLCAAGTPFEPRGSRTGHLPCSRSSQEQPPPLYNIVSVHRMVMENRPVDPGSIQGSHRPMILFTKYFERINQHMLGLLLQIWNALTSCSERMNPYSPVAAVLLHILNIFWVKWPVVMLLSCCCSGVALDLEYSCSGAEPDMAYYINFHRDSWSLGAPVSQVLDAFLRLHHQGFSQFASIWSFLHLISL